MSASLASGYHQGTKNRLARLRRATRVVLAARGCQKSPRRTCGAQTNAYTAPACMGMHAWACTPMCLHMHAPWARRVSSHFSQKGAKNSGLRRHGERRNARTRSPGHWRVRTPLESLEGGLFWRIPPKVSTAPRGSGSIEHPRFRNLRHFGPLGP